MLAELNLQTLEERRKIARLTMFHKIHYRLVAVDMPLQLKQYMYPTRTENALAYHLPTSALVTIIWGKFKMKVELFS